MTTKTTTKRIIIDYTQNFDLDYVLSQLEGVYFSGLSKSEITKLAIIELFKNQTKGLVPNLTSQEEESLAKAVSQKSSPILVPKGKKLSSFLLDRDPK